MHIISLNQYNEAERAGSLKRDTHVLAYMQDELAGNKELPAEYLLAKIVECQIQNDKFRYYITYVGHNRRLDRWVTEDLIISDQSLV